MNNTNKKSTPTIEEKCDCDESPYFETGHDIKCKFSPSKPIENNEIVEGKKRRMCNLAHYIEEGALVCNCGKAKRDESGILRPKDMNDEKLYDKLADILNAIPEIDPHDDESYLTDICFPKFKAFISQAISTALQSQREKMVEKVQKLIEKHREQACVVGDMPDYNPTNMTRYIENPLIRSLVNQHIDFVRELSAIQEVQ